MSGSLPIGMSSGRHGGAFDKRDQLGIEAAAVIESGIAFDGRCVHRAGESAADRVIGNGDTFDIVTAYRLQASDGEPGQCAAS